MKKRIHFSLCFGLVCAVLLSMSHFSAACDDLRQNVLRLHIIANSDSEGDQTLKLQVRDRVLREAGYKYGEFTGDIDGELLDDLRRAAQNEVLQRGYLYPVSVTRERMFFETRHVGRLLEEVSNR